MGVAGQGVAEGGPGEALACARGPTGGAQVLPHLRVQGQDGPEQAGDGLEDGGDLHTLARCPDGGGDQGLHLQAAEGPVQLPEPAGHPGHGDGAGASVEDLGGDAEIHAKILDRRRRPLAPEAGHGREQVQHADLSVHADGGQPGAPQPGQQGLGDAGHQARRHRRVHGVAPEAQGVEPRVHGQRAPSRDRPPRHSPSSRTKSFTKRGSSALECGLGRWLSRRRSASSGPKSPCPYLSM